MLTELFGDLCGGGADGGASVGVPHGATRARRAVASARAASAPTRSRHESAATLKAPAEFTGNGANLPRLERDVACDGDADEETDGG